MDAATIARYQASPPGDIYLLLQAQYGTASADAIAAAARTGDNNGEVVAAIANARTAAGLTPPQQDDSTTAIFVGQVTNDPLAAPAAAAGNLLSKSLVDIGNAVKKTFFAGAGNLGLWLLLGMGGVALFFYLGGGGFVRRKIGKL